jgi:hypothetical protein
MLGAFYVLIRIYILYEYVENNVYNYFKIQ